jgi:hypothetical protein
MGNVSNVGEKPAIIVVKIDQERVIAGSRISGKVYLSVLKETVDCTSLDISLQGLERTRVQYTTTTGTGKNRKRTKRIARATAIIFSQDAQMASFPQGFIPRGNYEYNFSFMIPPGMPSSMFTKGSSCCSVSYEVTARLHRVSMLTWTVMHTCAVDVVARTSTVGNTPCMRFIEPLVVPINGFFCFPKGHVICGGSVSSSVITPGVVLNVNYAILNRSTTNINGVHINLTETIRFRAKGHHSTKLISLFSTNIMAVAGDSALAAQEEKSKVSDDFSAALREVGNILSSGRCSAPVTVPGTMRESYEGALISVKHRLTITISTPGGINNPMLCTYLFAQGCDALLASALPAESGDEQEGHEDGDNDAAKAWKPDPYIGGLPADWSPVLSGGIDLSPPQYAAPFETEEGIYKPVYTVPLNSGEVGGASGQWDALSSSYDQVGELRAWLGSHNADELSPADMHTIFSTTRSCIDQLMMAELLTDKLSSIMCAHVAAVASGSNQMMKRDVVERILSKVPVVDKSNCSVVEAQLSRFDFVMIEKYFK